MALLASVGICGVGCGLILQDLTSRGRDFIKRRRNAGNLRRRGSDENPTARKQQKKATVADTSVKQRLHFWRKPQPPAVSNYVNVPLRQTLKNAWALLDGNRDGKISQQEFVKTCMEDLHFDLSEAELIRVFRSADADGNGVLTKAEFMHAVVGKAFFSNLVNLAGASASFQIGMHYDFDRSTNDNYKSSEMLFYGEFAEIREGCDYGYHVNYREERQAWQDSVIGQVVTRTEAQKSPWCIFTCGPMGAGKGYALSWMSTHGFFPIEGMVHVDPDYFKTRMPEFKGYRERKKEAGTMCHRESAFMQEIAQEAAMRKRQHVWIDGSLKDAEWFGKVFDSIRFRYPHYRIAIFYVWASEDTVRQRCADRARITGREIPEELMKASLQEPKESLAALIPKADFIARIDNNSSIPVLEAVEVIDRSGCWSTIRKRFACPDVQAHEFPNYLMPLSLQDMPCELNRCFKLKKSANCGTTTTFELDLRSLDYDMHPNILAAWAEICDSKLFELEGSAVHATPRDPEKRDNHGICDDAVTLAWIYEVSQPDLHSPSFSEGSNKLRFTSWKSQDLESLHAAFSMTSDSPCASPSLVLRNVSNPHLRSSWQSGRFPPLTSSRQYQDEATKLVDDAISVITNLVLGGGFVYFNKDGEVVQTQFHTTRDTSSPEHNVCIQFDGRVDMPKEVVAELNRHYRWATPNNDFFLKRGVILYAWCLPGEVICGHVMPPYGAFAFLFGNDQALYFPVLD